MLVGEMVGELENCKTLCSHYFSGVLQSAYQACFSSSFTFTNASKNS